MKLSFINDSRVKLRCCDLFVKYHNESRNISVSLKWKFWPSREILLLLIIIVLTYLFHYYLIPMSKVGREAKSFWELLIYNMKVCFWHQRCSCSCSAFIFWFPGRRSITLLSSASQWNIWNISCVIGMLIWWYSYVQVPT